MTEVDSSVEILLLGRMGDDETAVDVHVDVGVLLT